MTTPQEIQLRRDTSANWTAANPVLAAGEIGVDLTSDRIKVGDGSTAWNSLAYLPLTTAQITDATAVGRSVLTAADAPSARTAIGAGTSSLAIGTTSTTAKAGDYAPASTDITDATTVGRSVLTAADAPTARTALGAGTATFPTQTGNTGKSLTTDGANPAWHHPSGTVLAERCWDLTGYATPITTSASPARLHNDGVTFTVPSSGWVRVSLAGACWSTAGVQWMLLNGDGSVVPRTQLAINSNSQPVQSQLEIVVNCTATNVALVPGQSVTWYWGWFAPNGGTATFDNGLSEMKIEASDAPGYTVGSDSVAGQTATLTTIENVSTVATSTPSLTTTWAATPATKDLLLAVVMANVAPASWVLPSGWALALTQQVGTGARYLGLAYKVAGAAEPTSLTWTATAATLVAVHPWSKRGFTGTPAVGLTAGQSLTGWTGGNIDTSGGLASSPQLGIGLIGMGSTVTINRIGNGWDGNAYAGRSNIFADNTVLAMGASEKILTEIGQNARINPSISSAQAAAAIIVTFTGV